MAALLIELNKNTTHKNYRFSKIVVFILLVLFIFFLFFLFPKQKIVLPSGQEQRRKNVSLASPLSPRQSVYGTLSRYFNIRLHRPSCSQHPTHQPIPIYQTTIVRIILGTTQILDTEIPNPSGITRCSSVFVHH